MLFINSITNLFSNQQFKCEFYEYDDETNSKIFRVESMQETRAVRCPLCGGKVHIQGNPTIKLRDMPVEPGTPLKLRVRFHRYECQSCGKTFNEDIDLKYPGTRVTWRAALWIKALLKLNMTVKAVSLLTDIHWETISKIHKELMDDELEKRKTKLETDGYKPKHLAVDEFAIHKGHTYATCVMDLDEGDVLWVGKGRAINDFRKFFEEIDMKYLAEVEAVAMDMNASYNRLVEEYLPHAAIVYDRYHMQAQYGKEVLGSVSLEEAARHQEFANEIESKITKDMDKATVKELRNKAKSERKLYRKLKKSRWNILKNSTNLSEDSAEDLADILDDHKALSICYAMKEEMCGLFELSNPVLAEIMWKEWFTVAKKSGIPQLEKFAKLKEKRLHGLIAHATHPISTGKLEGFNNKIKVAKRIGYGYRNDDYFFTLVKYISLPQNRKR